MKKITKVILAAALVLLVAGAFTGAAAAAEVSAAAPGSILIVEDHVEAVSSVPGAEYHVTAAVKGAPAPMFAGIVKIEERGKLIPLVPVTPFTPPFPPFVPVKPAVQEIIAVPSFVR